jgi:8-oxo-dGTP diphosphatase
MAIYAAGVVCWREGNGSLEVLLVHRPKYKDWTFPKGKQDEGEYLPETAVREMKEETGISLKLGRSLGQISYKVDGGEEKFVSYWSSKAREKAWKKKKFKANEEVSEIVWETAESALKKLTYKHDQRLLKDVIRIHQAGELETRALVILRHALATPRTEWKGQESKRPLLPEGRQQAKRLVSLIGAFGPKRLVTSPWKRCEQTIEPYAKAGKKKIIERSQFTELSSKLTPRKTKVAVEAIFDQSKSALLCSHRPALPTITQTLANYAKASIKEEILAATTLNPAEFVVLRLSIGKNPKFVAIERWGL